MPARSHSPLEEGIQRILKEFRLPTAFPRKVNDEVKCLPHDVDSGRVLREKSPVREDLRDELFVTIDGETAKDFDDAVSVQEVADGGYLLKVSIADVSFYVRSGTAVDQEAYRRGTSTYFPNGCIPMLPEKLSNDLCSLIPHKDRLTFTAEMIFDAQGLRLASRFYRSVIRSRARLTYTEVKKVVADRDPEARLRHQKIAVDLDRMARLALLLQEVRQRRGSLDFDLPEPLIELDLEEGKIDRIVKAERNQAHRLIEEFMIAANEAVAEFITGHGRAMIYRVHGEPDPEKMMDFKVLLSNLGHSVRFGKKIRPQMLASVIEQVRGCPDERLVNTLLLRTLRQAVYDARNIGHFGLASDCYTHFTSPIRRYPDLVVHRILATVVGAPLGAPKSGAQQAGPLRQIATHCSERERNSMKSEWAARDLATTVFMKDKIGKKYEGIVAGVTRVGLFVELLTYFVQGLVSVRDLRDDYYIFHEKSHLLLGRRTKRRYQIGTPVLVRVKEVNLERRWVNFLIDQKR